MNEKFTINITR